jgi:hypothetical protein
MSQVIYMIHAIVANKVEKHTSSTVCCLLELSRHHVAADLSNGSRMACKPSTTLPKCEQGGCD